QVAGRSVLVVFRPAQTRHRATFWVRSWLGANDDVDDGDEEYSRRYSVLSSAWECGVLGGSAFYSSEAHRCGTAGITRSASKLHKIGSRHCPREGCRRRGMAFRCGGAIIGG